MTLFINPGSGPVDGADIDTAASNMEALTRDLLALGCKVGDTSHAARDSDGDGRWPFVITVNGREHEVDMPGLPLDRVRFMGEDDQNIWDFPRLYVDGSSWIWQFALGVLGDDDDE